MHRTCNFADRPLSCGSPVNWLERLAPEDPLFDRPEEEILPRKRPKRRRLARLAGTAATALALGAQACGDGDGPARRIADAILVQLAAESGPPALPIPTEEGPPIVPLALVGPADGAPLVRLPLPPGEDPDSFARDVSQRAGVEFAEPIYLYGESRAPNDPRLKELWGLTAIDAAGAWSTSVGDRRVTVAVVDDGVALTHPDLAPNLWVNPSEIAGNGKDDDGDGYIDDVNGWDFVEHRSDPSPARTGDARWHGSHVSGTIGAAGDNRIGIAGVNWKVALMALRGIGPSGGRSDDLARAIDYAVDHGARVINASWGGGGQSQVIARAIARAEKQGALFVAAAGNDGAASPGFPANLGSGNVLSVGALTPGGTLAPFSNRGALVAAPGVGILSTTAPGQYERYDGTSMAAPHVSGIAALLWSARPEATLAQVRRAILSSAVALGGTKHGRVDAARAMAALLGDSGGGGSGGFVLSRDSLAFTSSRGHAPRAQTVSLRAEGGGARSWTARADAAWVRLGNEQGETPARITVRAEPGHLGPGDHLAHVRIEDPDRAGSSVVLQIKLHVGDTPAIATAGAGCEMRDGHLHANRGATCLLSLPGLGAGTIAGTVQWRLPGGALVQGGRVYGQFVRRGEYQVEVTASEDAVESVPVVVE